MLPRGAVQSGPEGFKPDWIKPWAAQADLRAGPTSSRRLDYKPPEVPSTSELPYGPMKNIQRSQQTRIYRLIRWRDMQNTELADQVHSHSRFFLISTIVYPIYAYVKDHSWKSPDSLPPCQHTGVSRSSSPTLYTLFSVVMSALYERSKARLASPWDGRWQRTDIWQLLSACKASPDQLEKVSQRQKCRNRNRTSI